MFEGQLLVGLLVKEQADKSAPNHSDMITCGLQLVTESSIDSWNISLGCGLLANDVHIMPAQFSA